MTEGPPSISSYLFSSFCSISNKLSNFFTLSFADATLLILQSLLVSKDVESLMQVRYNLTVFLRYQFLSVIHSIASKTVQDKLFVLDFFVRAFAIVGDVDVLLFVCSSAVINEIFSYCRLQTFSVSSCLALIYEALLLRKLKSASCQWLDVSSVEWLNFVEDALHNGFHSIAEKACQHALLCIGKNDVLEPGIDGFSENAEAIRTITRLRNRAMKSDAPHSVQAQAAEYLTRKSSEKGKSNSIYEEKRCLASTPFRKLRQGTNELMPHGGHAVYRPRAHQPHDELVQNTSIQKTQRRRHHFCCHPRVAWIHLLRSEA